MLSFTADFSMIQSCQGSYGGIPAGMQVSLQESESNRWPVCITTKVHMPARCHYDQFGSPVISIWSLLPKWGNRCHDEPEIEVFYS